MLLYSIGGVTVFIAILNIKCKKNKPNKRLSYYFFLLLDEVFSLVLDRFLDSFLDLPKNRKYKSFLKENKQ